MAARTGVAAAVKVASVAVVGPRPPPSHLPRRCRARPPSPGPHITVAGLIDSFYYLLRPRKAGCGWGSRPGSLQTG